MKKISRHKIIKHREINPAKTHRKQEKQKDQKPTNEPTSEKVTT